MNIAILGLGFILVSIYLRRISNSIKFTNFIAIENEARRTRERLDAASIRIIKSTTKNLKEIESLIRTKASALQEYLNSLDRLAYFLLDNDWTYLQWKKEYHEIFLSAIQMSNTELEGSSPFPNIVRLSDRWNRDSRTESTLDFIWTSWIMDNMKQNSLSYDEDTTDNQPHVSS